MCIPNITRLFFPWKCNKLSAALQHFFFIGCCSQQQGSSTFIFHIMDPQVGWYWSPPSYLYCITSYLHQQSLLSWLPEFLFYTSAEVPAVFGGFMFMSCPFVPFLWTHISGVPWGNFFKYSTATQLNTHKMIMGVWSKVRGHCDLTKHTVHSLIMTNSDVFK